jgi:guanine deaminase
VDDRTDEQLAARAVDLALRNADAGQLPFGALVAREGVVLATGVNTALRDRDPTAHAEIAAVRGACRAVGSLELPGAILLSSCEPCAMCLAAAHVADMARIVYSTPKESVPDLGVHLPGIVAEMQEAWRGMGLDVVEHVPTPGSEEPFARYLEVVGSAGSAGTGGNVSPSGPTDERNPTDELARFRRVEEAARELLNRSQGRRSASQLLTAMAALRAALNEDPTERPEAKT